VLPSLAAMAHRRGGVAKMLQGTTVYNDPCAFFDQENDSIR
jgi:hypothetical protein